MKKLFFKSLVFIFGLLINTGCDSSISTNNSEHGAEYGMPHANYVLSGRVINSENQNNIEGIEVTFYGQTYTDANGEWYLDTSGFPCSNDCTMYISDIDEDDNGGFFTEKEVNLQLAQTQDGDGLWDDGTYELHDIEIELDPLNTADETDSTDNLDK